ncbi:hypothetical protein AU255_09705 [Methyloprofundus sedimenti]|uniref:Cell division coordinator CpoB n=1 Tax=Methyloprofundus sedimenti TaxID=1420851 RepID=A0A1V8M971_9GAMM|nr:tol-pal system protein YbgF [Methyloprofundus sedimenti]OQK18099.1 hypothetical protein AU255_09705 [Methyloprofundus sedimenti]
MSKFYLLIVFCISGLAHAESRKLPPIINNSSYANGAAYIDQASANQSMLEMLGRVESLQTEIQQLRGLIEQQSHEINILKQREQNIYADINIRLQQLESASGIPVSAAVVAKPETLNIPVKQSKVIAPSAVVAKPETLNIPIKQSKVTAPVTVKQAQVLPEKKVIPKSKSDEKAAFDKAFASVKNSHYQEAITELEQFLLDYPDGVYTDNAHFWLGSVYKVVNDIPAAKTNFQAVYTQYPKSEKAGMAMLKLADIYSEENNITKAQQLYVRIISQYADSTAANMAEKNLQSPGQ